MDRVKRIASSIAITIVIISLYIGLIIRVRITFLAFVFFYEMCPNLFLSIQIVIFGIFSFSIINKLSRYVDFTCLDFHSYWIIIPGFLVYFQLHEEKVKID